MAKQILNLGAILSDLIKNANSNFTELYNAISTIQETIADDGEKAIVFSTVDKMIAGLNAGTDESGNTLGITVGDEIYILDDETPDFWVSAVSTTSSTGTNPSIWEKDTNYVFGKYTIRVSKAKEITLEDYHKISDLVKSIDENASDNLAPTAKAVYNLVSNAINNVHTHSNKTVLDNTTANYTEEEKEKLAAIDESLIGVTASQIGKVTNVLVNGNSVLDNKGVANIVINIDVLHAEYVDIAADNSAWTTKTIDDIAYAALAVVETDTAVEMLNSSGQAVLTQIVRGNGNIYFCVKEPMDCTLRRVGGNSVSADQSKTVYRYILSASEQEIANVMFKSLSYNFNGEITTEDGYIEDELQADGNILSINGVSIPITGEEVKVLTANAPQGGLTLEYFARYDVYRGYIWLITRLSYVSGKIYTSNVIQELELPALKTTIGVIDKSSAPTIFSMDLSAFVNDYLTPLRKELKAGDLIIDRKNEVYEVVEKPNDNNVATLLCVKAQIVPKYQHHIHIAFQDDTEVSFTYISRRQTITSLTDLYNDFKVQCSNANESWLRFPASGFIPLDDEEVGGVLEMYRTDAIINRISYSAVTGYMDLVANYSWINVTNSAVDQINLVREVSLNSTETSFIVKKDKPTRQFKCHTIKL